MLTMITMTDGSVDDGNYLVLVRAQVMTRDDSSGGWVPMGGGGLSYVSVRKRLVFGTTNTTTSTTTTTATTTERTEEESKHEYLICGKRITDQVVVLSCTIKKDFEYNKVMPTFHHWRTGDKKFGLTFQTAADARAFDKGVRIAVEDLLEGSLDTTLINDSDVVDDDVFMAIDLPVERGDSQSSSGSSGCGGGGVVLVGSGGGSSGGGVGIEMFQSSFTHPHANHHHLHRMHYISRLSQQQQQHQQQRSPTSNNNNNGVNSGTVFPVEQRTTEEVWVRHEDKLSKDKNDGVVGIGGGSGGHHHHHPPFKDSDKIEILSEPYSYVQFARDTPSVHEYSYPMVDAVKGSGGGVVSVRDNSLLEGGPKKLKGDPVSVQPPLLPTKSKWKRDKKREKLKHLLHERSRCKHCHEMFNEEDNERGSCEYAPDGMRSCINTVTCLSCAQCMLYHCMSDAEGDFAHHPCSCDRTDEHCSQRWIGLTILSFFVPCLWCYLPMSTCHRCGIGYGLCGGRHEAT